MTRLPDGGWRGDNTDYDGFLHLLGADAEKFIGRKALVLGSGGAGKTVCAVLSDCKIPYIVVSRSGGVSYDYDDLSKHSDAELIVNATPVGMYPDNGNSPVDLSLFPSCRLVLDLIYNPAKTALLLQAEDLGIPARNGLSMLTFQAVRAAELFTGKTYPPDLADRIAVKMRRKTLNIALIGMPGCGKTTTAQYLSELTGRPMVDTDLLIADMAGMSIPEIFEKHGQEHFRRLETEALRKVSKESGIIIATGGGAVTVPENQNLIRQNSICVFLDCDIKRLNVEGRPLSKAVGIETLYAQRMPLYRAWADLTFRAGDLRETAKAIKKELEI
jgi:shikimate dehydrogenase